MNLQIQKLFETQKILDDKIVKEKGLEGVDLLDKKILALQVELGELANEWRGFKFWSEDQEPRINHKKIECAECFYNNSGKNPLLEEYVDCLHFILSIGLSMRMDRDSVSGCFKYDDVTVQFCELYLTLSHTYRLYKGLGSIGLVEENYQRVLYEFVGLGEMLGFTWQQIEQAYYDKNKVNHERQNNGY